MLAVLDGLLLVEWDVLLAFHVVLLLLAEFRLEDEHAAVHGLGTELVVHQVQLVFCVDEVNGLDEIVVDVSALIWWDVVDLLHHVLDYHVFVVVQLLHLTSEQNVVLLPLLLALQGEVAPARLRHQTLIQRILPLGSAYVFLPVCLHVSHVELFILLLKLHRFLLSLSLFDLLAVLFTVVIQHFLLLCHFLFDFQSLTVFLHGQLRLTATLLLVYAQGTCQHILFSYLLLEA